MKHTQVRFVGAATRALVLGATLLLVSPGAGRAQMGGLKKLKAKVEQARDKKAATQTRSVYDDEVLEITPDVAARFDKALSTELADVTKFAEWAKTTKPEDEYATCHGSVMMAPETIQLIADQMDAMDGMSLEQQSKATEVMQHKVDSVVVKVCGISPDTVRARGERAREAGAQKALAAGSFTALQYDMLKERVTPACVPGVLDSASDDGVKKSGDGKDVYWVYSATEVEVLRKNCSTLVPKLSALE